MRAVLQAWFHEPEVQRGIQRCAEFALEALHNDLTLRIPRASDLRKNSFALWRAVWRDRLGIAIEAEFRRQFPNLAGHLTPDTVQDAIVGSIWPLVEPELLAFAVEGLARTWVRRHMGDALVIRRPQWEGSDWVVPLGQQGREAELGRIVLDRDGNVIEEASSSRDDILAHLHG